MTGRSVKCKKRKYKTKIDAMLCLATLVNSKKGKYTERRFYWCTDCKAFHTTSK